MSFGELSVGEISFRRIVHSRKCLLGNCPSGNCPSRKCLRGTVRWGKIRRGNIRQWNIQISQFLGSLFWKKRIPKKNNKEEKPGIDSVQSIYSLRYKIEEYSWRIIQNLNHVKLFLCYCITILSFPFVNCLNILPIIDEIRHIHCVKSVRIRSFSGLYFPAFGMNTD